MSKNIIACRPYSYAPFEAIAYQHLVSLGIQYVEIMVPAPDAIDTASGELQRHGLTVSSMQAPCDVRRPDFADQVAAVMPAFDALGTKTMLVSLNAEDSPLETVHERLRVAGDVASNFGVRIVIETHPDLATNAAVALATMRGVNHPNVRINFDTANIYFYNQDVDGIDELRRMAQYVAAVHLKDTDGGYRHWHFPALGRGIVDFREVFSILDDAGFAGPCTIEIEGIEGEEKTERLVCDRIAETAGFLRGLGRL